MTAIFFHSPTDLLTETVEGLDRKFSLNYSSRMRFVTNLLPQLTAASTLKAGLRPRRRQRGQAVRG